MHLKKKSLPPRRVAAAADAAFLSFSGLQQVTAAADFLGANEEEEEEGRGEGGREGVGGLCSLPYLPPLFVERWRPTGPRSRTIFCFKVGVDIFLHCCKEFTLYWPAAS